MQHHQNKSKLFVWGGGPELKPFAQNKMKSCTNFETRTLVYLPSLKGRKSFAFHGFLLFNSDCPPGIQLNDTAWLSESDSPTGRSGSVSVLLFLQVF
jgi:hypothetical protein